MNKKEKTLFDKIDIALAREDACAISIGGKHAYAVMKWKTYQEWKTDRERIATTDAPETEKENVVMDAEIRREKTIASKHINSDLFDINDIPV